MQNTTLCHIKKDGKYLMLHRIKKPNDLNQDKWETEDMHIFHSEDFSGTLKVLFKAEFIPRLIREGRYR